MAAMAVLILIIFLMSGRSGGMFSRKLILRTYFDNAANLKSGAPVTLEGVTIGNVIRIRVVPERNPYPVEVTMRVGTKYLSDLHTDSTTTITQAGVLGDSFVDIDSSQATGPHPTDGAELKSTGTPNIQDVVQASQGALKQMEILVTKLGVMVDTLNSTRGTLGAFINDPAFYKKVSRIADNLDTITGNVSHGKGTLGKLIMDDTLYSHANETAGRLDHIATSLDQGKGTAGKLLHDETLYNNLKDATANVNELMAGINQGKGAIGKLSKDPAFAQKLDDTVTRLDNILSTIDQGQGTLGQLVRNRALYDHTDQTMDQAQQLLKAIRQDPKKYFVIRLKIF